MLYRAILSVAPLNSRCLSGQWHFPEDLWASMFHWVVNSPPHSAACNASVNWVSIGSGNGLSPVWRQAITNTWINTGLLSIGLLGTNFSEIWIGILSFSFKKMHSQLLSARMSAILSRVNIWNDFTWNEMVNWEKIGIRQTIWHLFGSCGLGSVSANVVMQ